MATGDRATLLKLVPDVAEDFDHTFRNQLKADISETKAITISSSPELARALARQLQPRGPPAGTTTHSP
eukprot:8994078-Pyramimonas_sp.AAC.1